MRPVLLAVTLAFATAAAAEPKAAHDPGALVLVLDRSLTMEGYLGEMKAAALASIAALAPDDQIAVVAFDSEAEVVAPLQRPAKRAQLARAIGALRPEGGTNLYTGLRAAHAILGATALATRHVILISDGDAPDDGLAELVADMRDHGETLSIIGLPVAPPRTPACCRSTRNTHRTLMSMLAKGSGRLCFVDDLRSLARTVVADARLALE